MYNLKIRSFGFKNATTSPRPLAAELTQQCRVKSEDGFKYWAKMTFKSDGFKPKYFNFAFIGAL